MISFSKLGKHGNLGNQLFEIAATIGLADKHGVDYIFPPWEYAKYFEGPFPQDPNHKFDLQVKEPHYHYADLILDTGRNVDLLGWFQSEKYWKHCEDKVNDVLKWKYDFIFPIFQRTFCFPVEETVAISIRRGDYIGNENYHQLELNYYLGAAAMFPDHNFLVFSDDYEYCKKHLPSEWNFMEGHSAIEQLAIGSCCQHFIIANSSFSWWMAYLGEKKDSIVIAPDFWNAGPLLQHSDDKDVVPERWIRFNPDLPAVEKIDLSDVTFTIPVKHDHVHRKLNLELSIRYLKHYFKTNIIIAEMDHSPKFEHLAQPGIEYRFYKMNDTFERTRMLNDMAMMATTPIIVNWDCDVFMKPEQLLEAANQIRSGEASGVYPYDGRFFRLNRDQYFEDFRKCMSMEMFSGQSFPKHQHTVLSVGGAIFWNREDFIAGGMENQFMLHYGPEDRERFHRFTKLGYKLSRIKGALFHMDHDTTNNGMNGHDHRQENDLEYQKVKRMDAEQLRSYVGTWPWTQAKAPTEKKECPLESMGFNRIYCLSMESRADRRAHMKELFNRIGLDSWWFFPAVDGKKEGLSHIDERITPGMVGCYESHKKILADALDNGYDQICVFEDDIKPIDGFNEFLQEALQVIPEDWEFAYLGCTEYGGKESYKSMINPFWVVPKCAWGTQAYMIRSRKAIQKLYDMLCEPQERQIDEELANHILPESGLKYYCIYPSAVSQEFEKLGTDVQKRSTKQKTI